MTVQAIEQNCTSIRTNAQTMAADTIAARDRMIIHMDEVLKNLPWFRIDQRLWQVISTALEKVKGLVQLIVQRVGEVVQLLTDKVLPWLTGPVDLAKSHAKWQKVAESVGVIEGDLNINKVRSPIEWQGAGATAYRDSASEQTAAAGATFELIKALQGWFIDHIANVLKTVSQLALVVLDVQLKIAAAATQFVLVENPTAWASILQMATDAISSQLTAIAEINVNLTDFLTTEMTRLAEVQRALPEAKATGQGGRWPAPGGNVGAAPGPRGPPPPWKPK
ncbi:MAG: hypothetical protein L0G99_16165 [Propionibacteriales bacterium]|nr:hypothetical protein [Propionibacteriales bacterium]